MIKFARDICNHFESATSREWLVTNGIGGYASGTIAGMLTRRYHGLLIAALNPPTQRMLLVAKMEETVEYNGATIRLSTNQWSSGVIEPQGYQQLKSFRMDGTIPVWTFGIEDAEIEKRIWMKLGVNSTYVRYENKHSKQPVALELKGLINYRDHHAQTHAGDWQMSVDTLDRGLKISAFDGAKPFYIFADNANIVRQHIWYRDFFLREEAYRGLESREDHLNIGDIHIRLATNQSVTILITSEDSTVTNEQLLLDLGGEDALNERQAYEQDLISKSVSHKHPPEIQQLVLAADQFVVKRPSAKNPFGSTVIAGYPWFADWGRDTMISLPGLTLTTGRNDVAREILSTYAGYVDQGMLPNRFPEIDEAPEYNTVDATLWFFEALRQYYEISSDEELLMSLLPVLQEIISWHQRGTRYNIHVDSEDGLLYAGQPDVQLTWMDAKVGDWVVTPRTGKPVEINALWYNALRIMVDFSEYFGTDHQEYMDLADKVYTGFNKFWNPDKDYCYDVIDGPLGNDPALRPNQIFAVSLHHSPLSDRQKRAVVDICEKHLVTPFGLRSLSPDDNRYVGYYGGDQHQRDASYHQGTVWGWLIGPFAQAHLNVYRNKSRARAYLKPIVQHIADHGVGSVSEIYDGNAPYIPRGCIAQAWSVAELLRLWKILM